MIVSPMGSLKILVIVLCLILWPINLYQNFDGKISFTTIFANDYQGEQLILRNIHLYPNVLSARIFQNKARIYLNKLTDNFFILTDPNNYFFALHPEPVPGQYNIFKFPFLSIVFFLFGILNFEKYRHKAPQPYGRGIFSHASSGVKSLRIENTSLISRLTPGVFAKGDKKAVLFASLFIIAVLSMLKNFEWLNFLLWLPISIIIIRGVDGLAKNYPKFFSFFSLLFIVFSLPELIRAFIK